MKAALMLAVAGSLGGCERAADVPARSEGAPAPAGQAGQLIDLAGVLSQQEAQALAGRLDREQQADGRPVIVVLVRPAEETSLEHLGWAVGGGRGAAPFLLLIDPERKQARIEGDLRPEGKAVVVRAMQPALQAERYAEAISAGLTALERLAP